MYSMNARKKKAGCGGHQQPATTTTPAIYHPAHRFVNRQCIGDTVSALGALLIYLLGRQLPPVERTLGWTLAERWLAELAEERLARSAIRGGMS